MEKRREKRFISYAKVILIGKDSLGYLRDINSLGCQIDFIEPPALQTGDQIEIQIMPNEELSLPNIRLSLNVKWMRQDTVYYSIGGSLSQVPDEYREAYQKLLSYFKG
jgi:hypothetical protein